MNTLPFDVRRYLLKQWDEKSLFAYILIDKLDFSIEWSENISTLYGINLTQNLPADEQLLFLQGIYPYQENQPLILEKVNFPTDRTADVHIIPSRYKLCLLLFDVTKTVQVHQELQQKKNELKLLYEQEMRSMRNLSYSYLELKRQKEFAETANRAKSEFIRHIGRDLKSPLNGILGFTQLLEMLENPLTNQAQEYVQEIKSSGHYLLALINELLDMAKIENDEIKINPQLLTVSSLIEECIQILNPIAKQKGIDFINRMDKKLPSIWIDPSKFRQIINNFLSNAIKYNRENGCIIISSYITYNYSIRISIKDTGIGIEPAHLQDVFEPVKHTTVENTVIKETKGGLSECKKLIGLMQGTIDVYSDVGLGSLFWFEFPLDKEWQAKTFSQHNPQLILYIDDSQAHLFLMNCLLEQRYNYTLLHAKNEADIFELINNHPVSIILLDTDAFDASYLGIFQALQTDEKSKNIPVIALFNANTDVEQIKIALNAGFYDYMSKPFDFNITMELFNRLAAAQSVNEIQKRFLHS